MGDGKLWSWRLGSWGVWGGVRNGEMGNWEAVEFGSAELGRRGVGKFGNRGVGSCGVGVLGNCRTVGNLELWSVRAGELWSQ